MFVTATKEDLKIPTISKSILDTAIGVLVSVKLTQEESDTAIARIEHGSPVTPKHKEPEDTSR